MNALAEVGGWHRSQQATRLVVLLGPLLALLAAGAAGNRPAGWIVVAVVLVSAFWASAPDSAAGVLALLLVLFWWTRVPGDALHPAALGAAVAVVACHVAAVLSSTAPPRTPVDPGVLGLWLRRAGALLVAAPVLWVLARVLRDDPAPDGLWPAALASALLVVVALSAGLAAGLSAGRERRGVDT